MTLTTTPLAGTSTLVEGTDVRGNTGSEVLDNSQWESIKLADVRDEAVELVDAAIRDLVAPITAAVKLANSKVKLPELDPLFYVVEQEEVGHVSGQPRLLTKLSRDSVILRALEKGLHNRLIWVSSSLTLTAKPVGTK